MYKIQKVYEDDTLTLKIEVVQDGSVFLHCTSYQWSPAVYKHYLNILSQLLDELSERGVEEIYALAPDKKVEKFANKMGFVSMYDVIGTDNRQYAVMAMEV